MIQTGKIGKRDNLSGFGPVKFLQPRSLHVPKMVHTFVIKKQPDNKIPLRNFPCIICCSQKVLYKFAQCDHKQICNDCLQESVKQTLFKKQVPRCLHLNCNKKMIEQEGSAYSFFSQQTKNKFKSRLKVARSLEINQIEKGNKLNHPCRKIDCEGVVFVDDFICVVCNSQHCAKCLQIHPGKNCQQALGQKKPSFSCLGFLKCPQCKTPFSKEQGGCNKFICLNDSCKHEFCIQCFQQWQLKHHMCGDIPFYKIPYLWFLQKCTGQKSIPIDKKNEQQICLKILNSKDLLSSKQSTNI